MTREILENGFIKLTGENGIIDKRTGRKHSVVICEEKKERYFEDAPAPEPVVIEAPKKSTKKK